MKKYYIRRGLKMAFFFLAFTVLAGFAVMYLWNWLLPEILGVGTITWVQALGLLALSRILFGSWGKGGSHRGPRSGGRKWRRRWEERYEKMTPEERAQFRNRFRKKCGTDWSPEPETGPGDSPLPAS